MQGDVRAETEGDGRMERASDAELEVEARNTAGREADISNVFCSEFSGMYKAKLKEIYERHMNSKDHACRSPSSILSLVRPAVAALYSSILPHPALTSIARPK